MVKWTLRVFWWLMLLFAIAMIAIWLVLAAPFFVEFRRTIVENILSEQIGQELQINDDVRVVIGPISRIYVGGVEIPSENIGEQNLAELNVLELDLDLFALLNRELDLDNLRIDGLQVNMLTEEDGTTSWTKVQRSGAKKEEEVAQTTPTEEQGRAEPEQTGDLFAFLSTRTVEFTSIGLTVENKPTGFDFIFKLDNLNVDQLDAGKRVGVVSTGTVNGQSFSIDGNYPRGEPFTTQSSFGAVEVSFNGAPIPLAKGGGFTGALKIDTGEIGDFLEVLGLTRTLEGRGKFTADLTSQVGVLNVAGLDTVVELAEGQEFTASGSVENLLIAEGFDIVVGARLYPEGNPPKHADKLKDLKLTGMSAHIVSKDQSLDFDELTFRTNSFGGDIEQVGPVSIDRIYRTEEGHLALSGVSLQAGPLEDPYLSARGDVLNLLEFKNIDISGELSAPASLVLDDLSEEFADAFGGVKAEFLVDDSQGHISLSRFDAYTVDTEIWALKAHAELGNVKELDALAFDFDLDVQDAAKFLGALQLKEVDVGPLELTASANGQGKDFTTTLGLLAGKSRIDASLETTVVELRPSIKGRIYSKQIDITDLKNGVAAIVQLSKMAGDKKEEAPEEESDEPEIQPLVLPEEESGPTDLVSLEDLLVDTDLNVSIDIEKIVGQQGVSSLSSELVSKEGKAKLGPVEANYGGGYFNVSAAMDLVETPTLLSVTGSTSGWDLGEILDSIGLGLDAYGKIRGNFSVTGNRASIKTFVNSMYGNASVTMTEGKIATSLIELAGLGVFPWLFSEELARGYSNITCVVAPITIKAGEVSSNSIVAETTRVQLVARGALNWRKDTISLRAEPRRVGQPLSRSAWPFNVTGKLSKPDFKLVVGGSKSRRADGADQMPAERKPCTPDIYQLK